MLKKQGLPEQIKTNLIGQYLSLVDYSPLKQSAPIFTNDKDHFINNTIPPGLPPQKLNLPDDILFMLSQKKLEMIPTRIQFLQLLSYFSLEELKQKFQGTDFEEILHFLINLEKYEYKGISNKQDKIFDVTQSW